MQRNQWWMVLAVAAAAAFAGGMVGAGLWGAQPVSAQAAPQSGSPSLPPIFVPGNAVTFGAQGPRLDVLQVHGDWIFVAQQPLFAQPDHGSEQDDTNRFWLHVPSISESWTLVEGP